MTQQQNGIDLIAKEALSIVEREKLGYRQPFTTLTWEDWINLQAEMVQCMARFQRAVEHRQAREAIDCANNFLNMSIGLMHEAMSWIGGERR